MDKRAYKMTVKCVQIVACLWSDRPVRCTAVRPTGAVHCGQTDRCGALRSDRPVRCTAVRPTGAVHCGQTDRCGALRSDRPVRCIAVRPTGAVHCGHTSCFVLFFTAVDMVQIISKTEFHRNGLLATLGSNFQEGQN